MTLNNLDLCNFMKTKVKKFFRLSLFPRAATLSLLCAGIIEAAPVDSEVVILVDGQTFSNSSFDLMLEGVAQAFEQQSLIDSLTEGPYGVIAASVMVFSDAGTSTAIPWMEMSSVEDLQSFATSVRSVPRPFSLGRISYVNAITEAAASIASSTAEGVIQQVTILEDGGHFYFSDNGEQIQEARDAALASGVDVINSVIYNAAGREDLIQDYYDANVVNGGENGKATVIGGSSFGDPGEVLAATIQENIVASVSQPTIDSNALSAVPEPSVFLLGALAGFVLLARRRR